METCRDCNHAEYNIIGMLHAAEIAWKQDINLFETPQKHEHPGYGKIHSHSKQTGRHE